jgi:hypothetical protein
MKRMASLIALLTLSWTAGCVERRFTITSIPTGAVVYHNGHYLGPTPVDAYLTYYGKQEFVLIKEGYETRKVVQPYNPPWFDLPGIDFVTENIYPFKLRDVRRFCYAMRPLQSISPDEVRQRAEQLRAAGQNIGTPAAPRPLSPAAPPGAILGPPAPNAPPVPEGTLPSPRPVPPPSGVNAPGS